MKKLLVYYSYTGNVKIIADKIKEKVDVDLLELVPIKPFKKEDYDAIVDEWQSNENDKKSIPIEEININLDDYDEIIIGTSVWWYTITPVIREFLQKYDLSNKKLYVYACHAGWLGRTLKEVESLCRNSNIISEANFKFKSYTNDLETDEKELDKFIESMK